MIRPGSRTNQLIAQMDHIPCQEQHLATRVFIISRPHKWSIDMRDLSLNYTVLSIVYLMMKLDQGMVQKEFVHFQEPHLRFLTLKKF